jgi:hypothetical protein
MDKKSFYNVNNKADGIRFALKYLQIAPEIRMRSVRDLTSEVV